jgi:CRP-like cAMP-binding protein/Na+/melibiose symporter-like transporter
VSERGTIYRTAFRHRDFRWLTLATAQSRIGDYLYTVALFAVVYERTHSAAWVSATAILIRVPRVLLPPFAGVLADRVERRNLMITLNIGCAAVMSAIAVCVGTDAPIGVVVALAVIVASLDTPYGPAEVGLLPSLLPEDSLAAANAVTGALDSLALVAGPAIGGALLILGSATTAFAINAGTFAAAVLCLTRVRRGPKPHVSEESGARGELLAGIRAIRGDSSVLVIASGLVAICFAVGATGVLFVLLSDRRLGAGAHGYGYLLAAVGVGGVISSVFIDRLAATRRLPAVVPVVLIVGAVTVASLAFIHNIVLACAVTAAFGASYLVLEVLSITLMQRLLVPAVLGKATGVLDAAAFGAVLLGAAMVAPVVDSAGITVAVLAAAAPALVAAALTLLSLRRLDSRSAAEVDALAPRLELLERVDVLHGATRPALERLAASAHERRTPSGETVVAEGEAADNFFVIVDGAAEVISAANGEAGKQLRTLGPGDCFGEIGLLEARPRTATVRTMADSVLLEMPGGIFVEVVTAAPTLADSFGAMVTTRLARSREVERR